MSSDAAALLASGRYRVDVPEGGIDPERASRR
jgi:hypothetical protein